MKKIRIICRDSKLSMLQAELVGYKIQLAEPGTEVEFIRRSSRGDRELHVSLSALDGTDFFTEDIFNALAKGEADIAVHSLKDMSATHFFSHSAFAVVDRDDVRDIALFNADILSKIRSGKTITIGTCSPRREEMAIRFLQKALPQVGIVHIETKPIRGNVEGRLRQLDDGLYDGTILATAGLNRLLRAESHSKNNQFNHSVHQLLKNKKLMLLPLFECVPAPCQGAIVAEAHPRNKFATSVIQKINDPLLFEDAYAEKKMAFQYGTGCLQKFGVSTIRTNHSSYLYAAGEDSAGSSFQHWANLPQLNANFKSFFSGADYMKQFFTYKWSEAPLVIEQPVVFVANYKSIAGVESTNVLQNKSIWAAGTKTWLELAKLGLWVQGSADALGVESMKEVWAMPLFQIHMDDVCILTHESAARRWNHKGYRAVSNYQLKPLFDSALLSKLQSASFIFWTSFSQFEHYGVYTAPHAIHMCAGGETASLLLTAGVRPVVFPTIKSFQQWRTLNIRLHSVA